MIAELFKRLHGDRPQPEPEQNVLPSPPEAPPGWSIVVLARTIPGVTSYETHAVVPREWACERTGPGIEMCGLNALEFRGFPPETLSIGSVNIRQFLRGTRKMLRITYRFDYKPDGWQSLIGRIPVFDYARLPLEPPPADELEDVAQPA